MKKLNLCFIAFILLLTIGCTKEKVANNTPTKIGDYYEHKLNAQELIQNDEDPTDVIFKRGLVSLSETMLEVLKDNDKRSFILDKAKNNQKGFVTFDEMFEAYPNLKSEINTLLSNSELAKNMGVKDYDSYVSTMIHTDVEYVPVVNIPNIDKATNTNNYFISPGIEVEDNDDLGIDDEIFTWFNNDGIISEISIGEEKALNEVNVIFVITQDVRDYSFLDNQFVTNNEINSNLINSKSNASTTWFIKQFKINMRYEATGRSELNIAAFQTIYPNVSWQAMRTGAMVTRGNFANNKNKKLLASVKPTQIGKYLYSNQHFVDNQYSNLSTYNLYEEDWFATNKKLSCAYQYAYCHNMVNLGGKRNYYHEWYLYNPNSNVNSRTFNPNHTPSSYTVTSSKCSFKVQKQ